MPHARIARAHSIQIPSMQKRQTFYPNEGIRQIMEYICLLCFHRWRERMDEVTERQCSRCKSRAVSEYRQFETVVSEMRKVIRRAREQPLISISKAVQAMSPLASRIRPGRLRIMRLWRKVLLEAGVRENDLDNYLPGHAT